VNPRDFSRAKMEEKKRHDRALRFHAAIVIIVVVTYSVYVWLVVGWFCEDLLGRTGPEYLLTTAGWGVLVLLRHLLFSKGGYAGKTLDMMRRGQFDEVTAMRRKGLKKILKVFIVVSALFSVLTYAHYSGWIHL